MLIEPQGLLDGESLVWEGKPSWKAYFWTTVLGVVLVPVVVGLVVLLMLAIRRSSVYWRVTDRRIETRRGWLSIRLDTLELWRVRDVEFRQSVTNRILGVASIAVLSQDAASPAVVLEGIPGDRRVYDVLMKGVLTARQQRGVMNVTQ